ncbi:flagellar protein FlaG [Microaerobacter geothermalis]|uniref:flagellar protein FlaG n=1 Tax=Microaerobacter geothermalis TaxID=674972 RepID=UPI001F3CD74B|nr:flagellar protein FlaG [Microaerobacter geothermalis]MCF6093423.1 flagellar protein FlaG [Microaerobacter geothermalis]
MDIPKINSSSSGIKIEPIDTEVQIKGDINHNPSTSNQVEDEAQYAKVSLSKTDAQKVVDGLNKVLEASSQTHLKFQLHEKLNEYYVTIVDDRTNQVIREIPPKKLLDIVANIQEALGLLVDKKI